MYYLCMYTSDCVCTYFSFSSATANVMSVISWIKGCCHCIFHVTSFLDWSDNCMCCTQCFSSRVCILNSACYIRCLVCHCSPVWNISKTIGWIKLKFCTDIHGTQRKYPTDFGGPSPTPAPIGDDQLWPQLFVELPGHLVSDSKSA